MTTSIEILLGTQDMDKSVEFYDRAFSDHLDWISTSVFDGAGQVYVEDNIVRLILLKHTANGEPATYANGSQAVLIVDSSDVVNKMYSSALEHGGTDEGAPGIREGDPRNKAYFRDPTGHKWMVVHDASQLEYTRLLDH